jgi:tyrosine-protein phosphatase YwqE
VIGLHCHILSKLDDGALDLTEEDAVSRRSGDSRSLAGTD